MTTRTWHPHTLRRSDPTAGAKLKPASQSYLNGNRDFAVIGTIFALAAILFAAHLWLIRLLA